jgi:hypothetical protein
MPVGLVSQTTGAQRYPPLLRPHALRVITGLAAGIGGDRNLK